MILGEFLTRYYVISQTLSSKSIKFIPTHICRIMPQLHKFHSHVFFFGKPAFVTHLSPCPHEAISLASKEGGPVLVMWTAWICLDTEISFNTMFKRKVGLLATSISNPPVVGSPGCSLGCSPGCCIPDCSPGCSRRHTAAPLALGVASLAPPLPLAHGQPRCQATASLVPSCLARARAHICLSTQRAVSDISCGAEFRGHCSQKKMKMELMDMDFDRLCKFDSSILGSTTIPIPTFRIVRHHDLNLKIHRQTQFGKCAIA